MTYRNRALLDLCHEAPCLLLPGQHQCAGQSEPCHSDMIRHGRGHHEKSHDCFAVPGCHNAHLAFTRSNLGKEGYFQAWIEAMERFILWKWISGKIRLTDITQRPKESTMEAPMCKICEHRHYVRDPHQFGKDAPRPLGIGHSESKSEGARRRVERSATSGASGKAKADTDTAKAPHKNTSAERGKAPQGGERTPGRSGDSYSSRLSAQAGETPAKNTSREGRRVLKPADTRTDRDHLEAQPASPPRKSGGNGTAAKPKTASKNKANKKGKKKCRSLASIPA